MNPATEKSKSSCPSFHILDFNLSCVQSSQAMLCLLLDAKLPWLKVSWERVKSGVSPLLLLDSPQKHPSDSWFHLWPATSPRRTLNRMSVWGSVFNLVSMGTPSNRNSTSSCQVVPAYTIIFLFKAITALVYKIHTLYFESYHLKHDP